MKLAEEYGVSVVCRVLDVPRSSFYYQPAERDDQTLQQAIETVAAEWPTYGYRRVTQQLHRTGWTVNHKVVQTKMQAMGLQRPVKRAKRRTTNSQHGYQRFPNLVENLVVSRPDQVWVADITYIRLRFEFVYLAIVMDVFTRIIRGWHLGRSLDYRLTKTALDKALAKGTPQIHHSDQGVQYAATDYVQTLRQAEVAVSMAEVGQAWQNGYAERVIRTIKEEEVDLSDYGDLADAYWQLGHFIDEVYLHKRIHSALGYLTPAEFESHWLQQLPSEDDIH
jgi:transposase InsO family protein